MKTTPLPTIWLATATACFGSQASSPTSSTSCSPLTPPAALMSATACSAPAFICAPKEAYWPVIGPASCDHDVCKSGGGHGHTGNCSNASQKILFHHQLPWFQLSGPLGMEARASVLAGPGTILVVFRPFPAGSPSVRKTHLRNSQSLAYLSVWPVFNRQLKGLVFS